MRRVRSSRQNFAELNVGFKTHHVLKSLFPRYLCKMLGRLFTLAAELIQQFCPLILRRRVFSPSCFVFLCSAHFTNVINGISDNHDNNELSLLSFMLLKIQILVGWGLKRG